MQSVDLPTEGIQPVRRWHLQISSPQNWAGPLLLNGLLAPQSCALTLQFGLQFANVMHGGLVFLRLVNLGLDLCDLFLDCRHSITSRRLSDPTGRASVLQSDVLNRHWEH